MSIFTILKQPAAILVTVFSNLIKVTNDCFIFFTQVDHKDTLSIIIKDRRIDRTCILDESQISTAMLVQNMTQVKPRSPAITQRLFRT